MGEVTFRGVGVSTDGKGRDPALSFTAKDGPQLLDARTLLFSPPFFLPFFSLSHNPNPAFCQLKWDRSLFFLRWEISERTVFTVGRAPLSCFPGSRNHVLKSPALHEEWQSGLPSL